MTDYPMHDHLVALGRQAVDQVELRDAVNAFVAGLGRSWPRGQTVLMAYALCRHLPEHPFATAPGLPAPIPGRWDMPQHPCAACGYYVVPEIDREWSLNAIEQARWSHDNAWPTAALDLESFLQHDAPPPTTGDVAVLRAILDVLGSMPADTPPSKAEKLLTAAKALPRPQGGGSTTYIRRLILMTLGLTGVLPQTAVPVRLDAWYSHAQEQEARHALGRSHRSDVMLPLAAWNSTNGIDEARIDTLFGHLI